MINFIYIDIIKKKKELFKLKEKPSLEAERIINEGKGNHVRSHNPNKI